MNVFRIVFTVSSVLFNIKSAIWNVVPSCFGLVSKENVGTIMPFQPSPHSLGKQPRRIRIWTLVNPVIKWAFKIISPGSDVSWELTLKSWHHVVKWQSVCRKVHPSRVSSENCKSLSWPKSIMLVPASNIWLMFSHV